MSWAKVRIYYDSIPGTTGSLITATSATSTDVVENIYKMLEVNKWKAANTTSPHYITVDLQAGNPTKTADYLAILGHNLYSAGATVVLQYSTDNFAADINDAFTAEAVPADSVYLKEFTQTASKRYWRLKLTGHTVAPYMAICIWGNRTELDYASASFDPHAQEAKSTVNMSYGGYVTGMHTTHTERTLALSFDDADTALYAKLKTWWETSGTQHFFVAWERTNNAADVFFMRSDMRFENPLTNGGAYRNLTLNLTGRKE